MKEVKEKYNQAFQRKSYQREKNKTKPQRNEKYKWSCKAEVHITKESQETEEDGLLGLVERSTFPNEPKEL